MTNASNYTANAVLDHITNNGAMTQPTTLYLALLKTASAASDDTTTNAAKEVETPGSNGYNRQAVALGAAASQQAVSTNAQTFGPSTSGWSEVGWAWVVDATTGGNILAQGALTAKKTVGASDSLTFAIGEVTFSLA